MNFDDLRYSYELEKYIRFCADCEASDKIHQDPTYTCKKFVKRKVPTKWALKKAEGVLLDPQIDDYIAIAFALDEVRKEFRNDT